MPQPVYVPVVPPRPAVELAQVSIVTLRSGAAPAAVRVRPGTTVTWVNAGDRERTLVLDLKSLPGISPGAASPSGVLAPNASFSVAFHQPGVYEYYLQDQPDRRARITVTEQA